MELVDSITVGLQLAGGNNNAGLYTYYIHVLFLMSTLTSQSAF